MKALITGASSGIGRDMARILSDKYDEIILVARNQEKLNELKEELIQNSNAKVKIIATDLSDEENCIKLHSENSNVDLLINNAGFGDYGEFTQTSLDKEMKMINTNVIAYHILTKLYLIDMKKENKGHILNVASIAGFMPGPLMATYYATKSYVVRLSEGIKEELKKDKSNVKISILCPGPVNTNFKTEANIKFNFNGISSYKVAQYALNHLNKFYIVPGLSIRLSRIIAGFIPSSIVAKIVYKLQIKRSKE